MWRQTVYLSPHPHFLVSSLIWHDFPAFVLLLRPSFCNCPGCQYCLNFLTFLFFFLTCQRGFIFYWCSRLFAQGHGGLEFDVLGLEQHEWNPPKLALPLPCFGMFLLTMRFTKLEMWREDYHFSTRVSPFIGSGVQSWEGTQPARMYTVGWTMTRFYFIFIIYRDTNSTLDPAAKSIH